jgi:hypothetical protein
VAGRAKDVVIIRGRNHYPQDIERVAEEAHPLLRRGCAAAFSYDEAGEERLALCLEVERGFDPGSAEAPSDVAKAVYSALRNAVAETFDVRVTSIGLLKAGSIPKTSSGKIQRRETKTGFFHGGLDLVARDVLAETPKEKAVFVAPRTETERTIAAIWAELLGVPEVGVGDDFFALGGQSLVATQAVTRVREALAVEVTLRELFESPTLGAFAEHIEAMLAEGAGRARVLLTKGPEVGEFPLGLAQERLWFLEELDPGRPTYHIAALLRLDGPLDRAAFTRAVSALARRHPSLRTTLVRTADGPRQRVLEAAPSPLTERSLVGHADPEAALLALADDEVRRPFELAHAPLLRLCLVALAEARHALVLTQHHLVSDGWSVSLLVRDLAALYVSEVEGSAPRLPALPVAYTDYAAWQRAWFASGVLDKQLAFWTKALEGAAHALELPSDRPRPPAQSYRGARLPITLPKALTADLVGLARRENATLYAVLAAAYALLLARFSGQKDLLLGTPVANRARPEAEGLVGFFVNTLVLRVDASGDPTGSELVARVRDMALSALANQDVPFERLVEALAPRRDLSRSPLFQALFALQNVPLPGGQMGGLTVSGHDVGTGTSKFDLSLELTEKGEGIEGFFEYATDLWDEATIARLRGAFLLLVEGLVRSPKKKVFELPMLDAAEQSRLLVEVNRTTRDYPKSALLHELFEAEASRAPERVAVLFEGHALTYGELEQRSNQLAHHLRARGVGPDVLVGLLVERGLDMVGRAVRHPEGRRRVRPARSGVPEGAHRVRAGGRSRARARHPARPGRRFRLPRRDAGAARRRSGGDQRPPDHTPGAQRQLPRPRVRHLHLGLDGQTQGRGHPPPRPRELRPRDPRAARSAPRRSPARRDEPVVRHRGPRAVRAAHPRRVRGGREPRPVERRRAAGRAPRGGRHHRVSGHSRDVPHDPRRGLSRPAPSW